MALDAVRRENLRLKAELRRVEEERDIPKKAAAYFAKVCRRIYPTGDDARAGVVDYIEGFYNRTRRHSHLGQVGPVDFEHASGGTS